MKTIKTITRNSLLAVSLLATFIGSANAQSWNLAGNAATDPNTMFIGTTDLKALRFRTNNQVRMAISNAGKIGVGTQTPVFKFDLRGGSYNTDSLYRINGVAVLSRDNTNRIQLGDGTVRVGIGTATPTTALQVIGTVTATEFAGGGSGITGINAGNISDGVLPISRGGTGANTPNNARNAIGAAASGINNDITALNALTTPISVAQGGIGNSSIPLSGQILIGNGIGYSLNNMSGDATLAGSGVLTISSSAVGSAEISDASISSIDIADGTISNTDINASAAIADTKLATISTSGKVSNSATTATNSNIGNTIVARDASGSFSAETALFSQDINVNGITIGKGGGGVSSNTANGFQALYSNTTGHSNTATGEGSLFSNTYGFKNTANGYATLYSNTTGYNNTAIGSLALNSNTTGSLNTANGTEALHSNTTGNYNTANGFQALYSNTTGSNNTVNGAQALVSNSTGSNNTVNGVQALYNNSTGSANTANGFQALYLNTTGNNNSAIGFDALKSNTTGSDNAANGYQALYLNTTGYYNTANGFQALKANVSGIDVTAIGANAGDAWSNINASVFVGSLSGATTNSLINSTAIGFQAQVDASSKVRIGNTAVTSIGGQVGWTTFSDGRYKRNVEEDVPGLEFITKLRPVTYTSDITGLNNHYPKPALREGQRQAPEQDVTSQEAIRYSGFIAQEVETAAKEIGYDFSGVDKPQREGNLYGLRYSDFVVPMVKAIQEQQGIIEKQQKEIAELKSLIKGEHSSGAIKIGVTDGRDEILLGQNIPNPADNSTIIPFSIPANCKSASILITDHATGRAIKAVPLNCKDTHLMLDAGSLASGTYSYSLFVDGVSIDTKQMVIVK